MYDLFITRRSQFPQSQTKSTRKSVGSVLRACYQYLRTLAQSAVGIVIEEVMREKLDQFIGAAWGECSRQQQSVAQ